MKNLTIFAFMMALSLFIVQCTPTQVITDNNSNTNNPGPVAEPTSDDAALDRSIPPTAGPAPVVKVKDAQKFTLSNGVEVVVVQNNKLPRVSFSLELDVDPMLEGDKAGLASVTGQLLRRGTDTKNKAQIDEEVDFIGANLSTYGTGIYGSSLTKHQEKLLELMSDVLLNPKFDETELEKIKTQTLSGLASAKTDPDAISDNVSTVLKYGGDHPYGELETEATIKNISVDDCQSYFETYFRPNTTRLVIVGDVDVQNLKPQLEKYFGAWEKGDVPTNNYDIPQAPKATEVAFVNKPGAVQSVITITYPVNYIPGSDEAIKARVMNSILGGGMAGRLFLNLREDKGYTYGAYSSLRSDELVGSFSASAKVRNEVTDSAIIEFLYEINRMRDEKVDEDDLNLTINQLAGSFARSLERPETVARFAMNIEKYNLPKDYYKNYLKRLRAVTVDDIQNMAKQYLRPENAYIVVVGNQDEVAPKLAQFSASGKVNFYDDLGNPVVQNDSEIPEGVTAESVIDAYYKAIGGESNLRAIKNGYYEMEIGVTGAVLQAEQYFVTDEKYGMELSMMGQTVQKQIFDGQKMFDGKAVQELDEAKINDMKLQSNFTAELAYSKYGYEAELSGVEKINGADAYKVLITGSGDKKITAYYDIKSGLKVREIASEAGTTIISDYGEYQKVGEVLLPYSLKQQIGPQNLNITIKSAKFNTELPDDLFKIE